MAVGHCGQPQTLPRYLHHKSTEFSRPPHYHQLTSLHSILSKSGGTEFVPDWKEFSKGDNPSTAPEETHRDAMPHTQHSSPPPKEMGSGAANSLTIIINFMHILCKPLVHRQDGIDLIRISIIEPFGRQLLIRGSVKHHRGWGGCRACSDLNPTGSPAGNGGQVPKKPPTTELITNSSASQTNATDCSGVTQPHLRGCSSGQGVMHSHPARSFPTAQQTEHVNQIALFSPQKSSSQHSSSPALHPPPPHSGLGQPQGPQCALTNPAK